MAGKFLSRAFLSLFMDKRAREKFEKLQAVKKGGKKSVAPTSPGPAVAAANTDDGLDILPETLIQRAIDSATAELERKKNLPPDRQALIEQALSIHDHQTKLLDDLPKDQREKLIVMAMHAFGAAADEKKVGAKKPTKKRQKK